jgi:antirestriction protein
MSEAQIYVADLAAYNAGTLYGKWIDAEQSAEEIEEEVQEMLKASPCPGAEEWAIHDYEGFEGIKLSEYESFETVSKLAEMLAEHGASFAAYFANESGDLDYALEHYEEAFCGEYKDEEDFAYEEFTSCYEIPSHLENYIDWGAVARDLFCGDYWKADSYGGIYVFRSL